MAAFDCIAATGRSLERLLTAAFAEANPLPAPADPPHAVLIRTEDLAAVGDASAIITPPVLTLLLYRVDFNKTTRAGWSAVGSVDGRSYLPLDLHFLLTPWATNAEYELRILGRALQALESHPSLSGPLLAGGGWAAGDSVQVLMEEVSTEAVMRTFDSLPHDYKLSVPYVARVVRLDSLAAVPQPEVVTVTAGLAPSPAP
ncbi:MAG TPA: DUF4255 domain-containing protein [Longimicrobium sp.]|uniref:DUF4255 domain-containing protein n=1 Tax=Longimicrobium sp. TaxID=2029185 RepID=UPI002ED8BABC